MSNNLPYIDITNEWLGDIHSYKNQVNQYNMGDTYTFKGTRYKIDGHHVKYKFDKGEDEFAKWLANLTKKKITLMPKIEYPLKISSPDFKINNIYYDLKTISDNSSQIIYHRLYNMEKQAKRFFFNVTKKSNLTMDELIKQASRIFERSDTNWVEMIGIKKDDNFVILKKKKKK